jgi:hypothetical protein
MSLIPNHPIHDEDDFANGLAQGKQVRSIVDLLIIDYPGDVTGRNFVVPSANTSKIAAGSLATAKFHRFTGYFIFEFEDNLGVHFVIPDDTLMTDFFKLVA